MSLIFLTCQNPSSSYIEDESFTPSSPESNSPDTFNEGLLDFPELTDFTTQGAPDEYQNLLILYGDESDDDDSVLLEQVKNCYDETNIHCDYITISEFKENANPFEDLGTDDIFISATLSIWKLDNLQTAKIIDFVDHGGHAVFLITGTPEVTLKGALGITNDTGDTTVTGMTLDDSIFPGMDEIGDFLSGWSFNYELDPDCRVLATSGSIPLIWTRDYGSGSFLYTNSTCFQSAYFRGLLLQLTGMNSPYFLSTCYNTALLFIDDFPLPLEDTHNAEVGMSESEFVLNQWWPDIKELWSRFSLMYSCYAIGNYDNVSQNPSFELKEGLADQFDLMGEEIKEVGAELGLHGYNHVPLARPTEADFSTFPDDGQGWENQATMEDGLEHFQDFLYETYGYFPVYSYVPPMNRMSDTGKKALDAVFPDITNIDGVFQGSKSAGDLIQEPGPDPEINDCFNIPRFSSGYNQSEEESWVIYDTIAWCGLFSHFVHPDDAMDPGRNGGKSWSQMYHSFLGLLEGIFYNFPELRRMSSGQFTRVLEGKEDLKVYSYKSGNYIYISYSGGQGPVYHYLRLPEGQKVSSITGGSCRAILPGDGLYLLEGRKQQLKIRISS